jgi:glutathione S-transferase
VSELLALARAARRLGVSSRWLKSEATAGRVPCLRADSRFLFDETAVTEVLRERAAAAPIGANSAAVCEPVAAVATSAAS